MTLRFVTTLFTCSTGGGNQTITTTDLNGLIPSFALFEGNFADNLDTAEDGATICIGATDGVRQWGWTARSENNVTPTDCDRVGDNDGCIFMLSKTTAALTGKASFSSFVTNGITINWSNAANDDYEFKVTFIAGDISVHVGTFNNPNSLNGTLNVTAPGFEPEILIFSGHNQDFNGVFGSPYMGTLGWAINDDLLTQYCFSFRDTNGSVAGDPSCQLFDLYSAAQINSSGVLSWATEVTGFLSNGFQITNRIAADNDEIGYVAIKTKGKGLFKAGNFDTPSAPGNGIHFGLSFRPELVMMIMTEATAYNTPFVNNLAGTWGISTFDDKGNQNSISTQVEDGANPTDTQCMADSIAVNLPRDDGSAGQVATLKTIDIGGWTLDFTTANGQVNKWPFLAFGSNPIVTDTPLAARSYQSSKGLSVLIFRPDITVSTPSYSPRGTLIDDQIGFHMNTYTHTIKAIGGYWSMSFTINDRLSNIENWIDRLGYHVEIYSPSLIKIWEGLIVNVSSNIGGLAVQRGPLTDIANELSVVYSTVDTTTTPPTIGIRSKTGTVTNSNSQDKYGIIEKNLSIGGAQQVTAEQVRDTWLAENAQPTTGQAFNSGSSSTEPSITVDCLGYVWFLNLFLYNSTTSGTRDISDIIEDVLSFDPNGLFSTDYSGIETNTLEVKRYTNNDKTAFNYIKSLVSKGDVNDNRYLFGIYNDRKAKYGAIPTDYRYIQALHDPRQRIISISGIENRPWEIVPGQWLFLSDFLIGRSKPANLRDDSRMVFLESVTYTSPWLLSYQGGKVATLDQKLAKLGLSGAG